MAKFVATSDTQVMQIPGPGNFQFSTIRMEKLNELKYTLVTIVCDISSSVAGFSDDLLKCIKTIIEACKSAPTSENLLVRILHFNQKIYEIHGFLNLKDIDINNYDALRPDGFTALYDATYDAVGATVEYSRHLVAKDYECNGAVYIITDGMNNRGTMTPESIREKIATAVGNEHIESLISILIGLHNPKYDWEAEVRKCLEDFKNEAELTEFLDIGKATAKRLAKLATWVSSSISSQSQSLGTGGPSQVLAF